MNETDRNPRLESILSSHGAVVALMAALLYLAGITSLTMRMKDAGLVAQDTLPLFSLDQLLRIGLTWIYPAVPALLALIALCVLNVYLEGKVSLRAKRIEAELAATVEESERDAWRESYAKLCKSTDWPKLAAKVKELTGDHPDVAEWRRFRRELRAVNALTGAIYIILLGSCLALTALVGALTFAALVIFGIVIGARPTLQLLLPLYALVAIGFLASAIFYPRPLPEATLVVEKPAAKRAVDRTISGDLVVISDNTWYLGMADEEIVAVPSGRIIASDVRSRSRSDNLFQLFKKSYE